MQRRHLTRLTFVLALTAAGAALAEGQVCIHRTADGRCLHWVPTVTGPGGREPQQHLQTPQATSAPATTTGCMYDPGSRAVRQCFHITADGRCAHFGGPCN